MEKKNKKKSKFFSIPSFSALNLRFQKMMMGGDIQKRYTSSHFR